MLDYLAECLLSIGQLRPNKRKAGFSITRGVLLDQNIYHNWDMNIWHTRKFSPLSWRHAFATDGMANIHIEELISLNIGIRNSTETRILSLFKQNSRVNDNYKEVLSQS